MPIGTVSKPFAGTFDGQGFTISGLSVEDDSSRLALFGVTAPGSTITNVRLTDSTIIQTATSGTHYTGSIVAEAYGTLDKVYSDAIVESNLPNIGGIVAIASGSNMTMNNCWFAGKIEAGQSTQNIGGIVGNQSTGSLTLNNALFTGVIDADSKGAAYIGGLVGNSTKTLSVNSAISAGQIIGQHSHSKVASVVGNLAASTNAFANVFSARDCYGVAYNKTSSSVGLTGEAVHSSSSDRLLGYIPQGTNGVSFNEGTVNANGQELGAPYVGLTDKETAVLTFGESGWAMRNKGVPVLSCFKDIVGTDHIVSAKATDLAKEIGLDLFGSVSITDVMESGMGNYVYSYVFGWLDSISGISYDAYRTKLTNLGFSEKYNNDGTTMASDKIKASTWTKGEWVVNVTYVDRSVSDKVGGYYVSSGTVGDNVSTRSGKRIYISFNTSGTTGADTLKSDNALATAGGSDKVTLAMLEDKMGVQYDGANSFVFRLPNGHFVINDGGYDDNSSGIGTLLAYLKSQTPEGKVYIDAWTISHFHNDHMAVVDSIINHPELWKDVCIDAFYVSEPSTHGLKSWDHYYSYDWSSKMHKAASMMTKADGTTKTDVWQLHMGQRYYFNGLTMDVVETSEQHMPEYWSSLVTDSALHLPDAGNTCSTQLIFTVTASGQKVLLGGDATLVNMDYMMQAYGSNSYTFSNISVLAAYHHGKNVYFDASYGTSDSNPNIKKGLTKWADFMLKNTKNTNGTSHQFDVVLFPHVQVMDVVKNGSSYYLDGNTTAGAAFPRNVGYINRYFATNAGAYYTMGYEDAYSASTGQRHGNVILTFNSDSVSAECKSSSVSSTITANSVAGRELWWADVNNTNQYYTK